MTDAANALLNLPEEIRDVATAKKFLDAGRKSETAGDKIKAIESYEAAYTADPDNTEVCFRLAYLLDLVGEEDEALHLYEQCVHQSQPHLSSLFNLAILYEDRGMYSHAERCLRQIMATDPNNPRVRLYIKDVMASKGMVVTEDHDAAGAGVIQDAGLLDTPVTDFDLSVKTRNALRKMTIRTLADLLRVTESELRSFKNLSEDSIDEIKKMLAAKGLHPGQTAEQQQSAAKKVVFDQLKNQTGSSDETLNRPVTDLQLSVRARKALALLNVQSLGDLCTKTEAELMGVKNFGMTSLLEIKEKLIEMGLSLRTLEDAGQ